jgi:7-keto-8-aminopelargonate synthetase-like enzyme
MSNYEIIVELNKARQAVERLHGGFQQVVHRELPPIDPVEARAILERIQSHPDASEEQRQEAAYLLAALHKKFPT